MAKVIGVNGSPRRDGNTAHMLQSVLDVCKKSGHDTELYQAGGRELRGCMACYKCRETKGKCAIDDWMNELYGKMVAADAIILGSPVYTSAITADMKAVIDRCGFVSSGEGKIFRRKIGAAVSPVRRAGSIHTLDTMNHFFLIHDMVLVGSTYWNMSLARNPGDYENDEEGVATMRKLGDNIVWLLEKLF